MNIGKFIGGGVLTVVGLFGLGISARAHDAAFSLFGLLLFIFAILVVFRFITLATAPKGSH
jgi:hypothetical protein